MKRIWHPYTEWEEYHAGMWRSVTKTEADSYLAQAIEFTGDAELYGKHMLRVIVEWPKSCEQNLTDTGMNRKAWIGHAACCLAIGCPEYITRKAWGFLGDEQQRRANMKAEEVIKAWGKSRAKAHS